MVASSGTPSDILREYCIRYGLDPKRADLRHMVPQLLSTRFTGDSTLLYLLLRFIVGVRDASVVYLPVHIIPAVLFKGSAFLKTPKGQH